MPIEQIVKGTTGFLSILTKKYQLLVVMLFVLCVASTWSLFQSDWQMEAKVMVGASIFIVGTGLTMVLARLGSHEEEELLKNRTEHSVSLQKDLETHKAMYKSIDEANLQIREWKMNHPPPMAKGFHPFGDGVKVELKETPTGVYIAILHIKGKPSEEYRLYK